MDGIRQAVGRYYADQARNTLGALVFHFDSETHATSGLDALDPAHGTAGREWEQDAITIGGLDLSARAYRTTTSTTGDTTIVLSQEGTYVYLVDVSIVEGEQDAISLAADTIRSMMAAAGEGIGTFNARGGSTGGAWDKLPPGDGISPPGFQVERDRQIYPMPPATGNRFDYSRLDGIQRAVGRTYAGHATLPPDPDAGTPPPVVAFTITLVVSRFDGPAQAARAVDSIFENRPDGLLPDVEVDLRETGPFSLGEHARGAVARDERDGEPAATALLTVQRGPLLYVAIASGQGAGAGAMTLARSVVVGALDAAPGAGTGTFRMDGSSTGGLWDALPRAGDDALGGLAPQFDEQVHPRSAIT